MVSIILSFAGHSVDSASLPSNSLEHLLQLGFSTAIKNSIAGVKAGILGNGANPWSDDDILFANSYQQELGRNVTGLADSIPPLQGPIDMSTFRGGGSDDIGDISWNMPTVTLRFPSNMPGGPGHNWANGIAMATPVAHKGGLAGAKVQAMTVLDLLLFDQVLYGDGAYHRAKLADLLMGKVA